MFQPPQLPACGTVVALALGGHRCLQGASEGTECCLAFEGQLSRILQEDAYFYQPVLTTAENGTCPLRAAEPEGHTGKAQVPASVVVCGGEGGLWV